jgi:hypothetical protein
MAKPRIFISSTFFDLRQVRSDIDRFIKDLGYEGVRNEQGNIPYGKEEKLEEYCYKEISNIDILISIIGGRFGSASTHENYSVSQMEIKTALNLDKQVFIFVDKNVYSEYRTYLSNKINLNVKYHYVDNIKIYEFIEQLEGLPKNNPIQGFESSEEIVHFLKEQWAGLFQSFLQEQRRLKEVNLLQGLENTASTLNQLINYLTEEKKGAENVIRDILISNHPAFERLSILLNVQYRIFFLSRNELTRWLKARNYEPLADTKWDSPKEEEWLMAQNKKQYILKVNSLLFDEVGNLRPIQKIDWNDNYISQEINDLSHTSTSEPIDDLPF